MLLGRCLTLRVQVRWQKVPKTIAGIDFGTSYPWSWITGPSSHGPSRLYLGHGWPGYWSGLEAIGAPAFSG